MLNKKIVFNKAVFQQQEVLCIRFPFDLETNEDVRAYGGVRWSTYLNCFYLPFSKKRTNQYYLYLKKKGYNIDHSALKKESENGVGSGSKRQEKSKVLISPYNQKRLERYRSYLTGLRLSKSTITIYSSYVAAFLDSLGELPTAAIGKTQLIQHIEKTIQQKQYSINTHSQLIGALKHFSQLFLDQDLEDVGIKRPKKNKSLPAVLSQEEVILLIRCTYNLKHRAILTLLYSSGLRIGESIALRLSDIDLDRMQLRIRFGKGRKDRYVGIAQSFLPLLKNYLASYRPKIFFVEGPKGTQYTASSIRKFLYRSCKRAGISKKITPHTLRHSYATHLIENGVGLRHVQELLGHAKPETTMVYTHVARKDLLQIESPLDSAVAQLTKSKNETQNIHLSRNSSL